MQFQTSTLDSRSVADLNRLKQRQVGDPEIETRIAQYEMAFRMQASVPELTDISDEPQTRTRSVRSRRDAAGNLRATTVCWHGVWSSATCVSCSSITWAGINTTTFRTT